MEQAVTFKQKLINFVTDKSNHKKLITLVLILIFVELVALLYLKKDSFNLNKSGNSAQISQSASDNSDDNQNDDDVIDVENLGSID